MRPLTASLLAASLIAAPSAGAQRYALREVRPSRAFIGIGFDVGQPKGEFATQVGNSYGADLNLVYALDRSGAIGLRVDLGYLNYGHERNAVPLSSSIGGRITVDLSTDNNILLAGVGPQLMLPNGPVRPYVNGTVGIGYFFTQSSIQGSSGGPTFAQTTNFDDARLAWSGGGGVYIPLRQGRRPISLDVGAHYQHNGETSFLRRGSITDNPDGSISFTPIRTQANLLLWHFGASFGM